MLLHSVNNHRNGMVNFVANGTRTQVTTRKNQGITDVCKYVAAMLLHSQVVELRLHCPRGPRAINLQLATLLGHIRPPLSQASVIVLNNSAATGTDMKGQL